MTPTADLTSGQGRPSEAAARFRAVVDQAFAAILVGRNDGTVEYANPTSERLTGCPPDDLLGKPFDAWIPPDHRGDALLDELRDAVKSGDSWRGILALPAPEGARREVEFSMRPLRDADGGPDGVVLFLRDVTRESELEAQMRQAHKMHALGTLAGGIAHDFNNILQTILGYASLLSDETPTDSRARHYVDEICNAGDRAAELVGQIQNFSRQTGVEPTPVLLQPIVKETLKLLRGTVPPQIVVRPSVHTRCGQVMADPTQIHQLLIDLCSNAVEAMRAQGGTLTVVLEEVEAGPPDQPVPARGRYVRLTVSDTGPGLGEEDRRRLLEPRSGAAPAGPSKGMGLASIREVLDRHNAALDVRVCPGEGTTFEIFFARCQPAAAPDAVRKTRPGRNRAVRVLFVDDEMTIVQMGKAALARFGYEVHTHTHSPTALKEFQANPNNYDVVVTDEVMPELSGSSMALEMLRVRPDLPIVLCSGFVRRLEELRSTATGVRVFMGKPFLPSELAGHIRALAAEERAKPNPK